MKNAINKVFFQHFKIELVYTTKHVQIQYFEACNSKRSKRSKHAENTHWSATNAILLTQCLCINSVLYQ